MRSVESHSRGPRCGLVPALICGLAAISFAADTQPSVPPEPALRVPQTQMEITQLSNDKLDWLLDAKFGMFIHWGLYSGDQETTIRDIDRNASPADSVVAVTYDHEIRSIWQK